MGGSHRWRSVRCDGLGHGHCRGLCLLQETPHGLVGQGPQLVSGTAGPFKTAEWGGISLCLDHYIAVFCFFGVLA